MNNRPLGVSPQALTQTQELQPLLDQGGFVIVPKGAYTTDVPLRIAQPGTTVYFEPGVTLTGIGFGMKDNLIEILADDVTIFAYGCTFSIEANENNQGSPNHEGPHVVRAWGRKNITVSGGTYGPGPGDGMYFGTVAGDLRVPCENVTIRDVEIRNTRRSGITFASVKGATVSDCMISDVKGAAPQSLVIIEPNSPLDFAENVMFERINGRNPGSHGCLVNLSRLSEASATISIIFEDSRALNLPAGGQAFRVEGFGRNDEHAPMGKIVLRQGGNEIATWERN